MGGGDSKYVREQEIFVKNNYEEFKNKLPERYCRRQIEGKLRQLYANSDNCKDNRGSYINEYEWGKVKLSAKIVYPEKTYNYRY